MSCNSFDQFVAQTCTRVTVLSTQYSLCKGHGQRLTYGKFSVVVKLDGARPINRVSNYANVCDIDTELYVF
jgi:hypothetical protein